jgi:bifunctional DNA primase/polymerase-like protein
MSATTQDSLERGLGQDGNARTIACGYIARGWAPLPIPHGAKAPTLPDWQKNKIKTAADVSRHFDDGASNIGILLGTASAGLTDADLDCGEAVRLADGYLPRTASTFGRLSRPRSHRLYVASGINREAFADPESKELYLELRGNKC